MRLKFAALLLTAPLLSLAAPTFAQSHDTPAPPSHPVVTTVPPAKDADVQTIDGIIAAIYDVISGPPGQARDFNRMRSLFVPGARMMPVGGKTKDQVGIRLMTVNDYIASSGPLLLEKGFHEKELARKVEQFGNIAHVFTTYEAKIEKDNVTMRGINSLQLMHDGKRWWIVSLMWQAETPELPLPAEYLPAAK
jgi:hypothetical protein